MRKIKKSGAALTVAVAAVLCTGLLAGARAEEAPAAVSPDAKAILIGMAEFMSNTQSFSVDIKSSYDVYQPSGQKIEFAQKRKITLARPDRLRVEIEESDGDKGVVLYDGKDLTMASPNSNVYAQAPKAGTVDDAIVYFVRDLGMKMPLAVLLMTTAPSELDERTQTLDYIEKTDILGEPAHHLAGRTESVDYQVWIAAGDKPLPLRVVLTYRNEEGQPEFRAQFSDWDLAPEVAAGMFTYEPPKAAQKISFLALLPQTAAPLTTAGGEK